jgi:hypothetical protein
MDREDRAGMGLWFLILGAGGMIGGAIPILALFFWKGQTRDLSGPPKGIGEAFAQEALFLMAIGVGWGLWSGRDRAATVKPWAFFLSDLMATLLILAMATSFLYFFLPHGFSPLVGIVVLPLAWLCLMDGLGHPPTR